MPLVELTPELALMKSTAARFIESELPVTAVRERIAGGAEPLSGYLKDAAALGWFCAYFPEEFSGGAVSGSPVVDAAVVAEERGAGLQPGPFVGTHLLAHAVTVAGTDRQRAEILPALATGEQPAAWAAPATDLTRAEPSGVAAIRTSDGWTVDGQSVAVHECASAHWLLVSAHCEAAPLNFVVPIDRAGITARDMTGLDLTTTTSGIEFSGLTVYEADLLPDGPSMSAERLAEDLLDTAALLTAIDSLGAMDRLLKLTVDYALTRRAFGRQIGSFQAIKHQLADLSLLLVAGQLLVRCAIEAVAAGAPDRGELVNMAKATVCDGGFEIAAGCMQVHGGIGYAWEHDLHLYVRRLAANSARYGDATYHRERICRRHGL